MRRLAALLMTVLLLGTAACGDEAAAGGSLPAEQVTVTIAGGTVTPPPGRVELTRGQTLKLTVTSDIADMVHVHGYDRSATLRPAVAGTVEFVADTPGLFEVETHGQELQLFQLVVR